MIWVASTALSLCSRSKAVYTIGMKIHRRFFVALLLITLLVPAVSRAQTSLDLLRSFLNILQMRLAGTGGGMNAAPRPIGDSGIHMPEDATIFQGVQPAISPAPIPNREPNANAGADQTLAPGVTQVTLNGSLSSDSDGQIVSYVWRKGNFVVGTVMNPTISLPVGTHTITLTVTDDDGARDTDSVNITITPPDQNQEPVANAGPDQVANTGTLVSFNGANSIDPDGTITQHHWDFGDGASMDGATAFHTYSTPAVHTARLTVTDDDGATDDDTALITVSIADPCSSNLLPAASAGTDQTVTEGATVSFTGTGLDLDGTITGYAWNFGDGSTGSGVTPTHVYTTTGVYTATLTVTDNCGASASDTSTITINGVNSCVDNSAPLANAGMDRVVGVGETISFSGLDSVDPNMGDTILSYMWSFGDGFGGVFGANQNHVYDEPGTYIAHLVVKDECQFVHSDSVEITVLGVQNTPPTIVSVSGGPTTITWPNNFTTFSAVVTDDHPEMLVYQWVKESDSQAEAILEQYSLTTPVSFPTKNKIYKYRLKVTDNGISGSAPVLSDLISIFVANGSGSCSNNHVPNLTANPSGNIGAQVNQNIIFSGSATDQDSGQTITYKWNFGDGSAEIEQANTNHAYNTSGVYLAYLTARDSCGSVSIKPSRIDVSSLQAEYSVSRLLETEWGRLVWSPSINLGSETVSKNEFLKFNGTLSTGGPFSLLSWLFGDGGFETGEVVYHQYDDVGNYGAALSVFSPTQQNISTNTKTVNVTNKMTFLDAMGLADDSSMDIVALGSYAYTTHSTGLLTTLDISNPSNMQITSAFSAPIGRAIAAANNHVYVGASSLGLTTYTATANPTFVGTYNTNTVDGQSVRDLMAEGKVVFMAAGPAGLKIVNMSDPANPTVIASKLLPNNATAEVILIQDGRAYIADTSMRVHIYDISMINVNNPVPANPILISTLSPGWNVHQLARVGDDTLVAQANPGGMHIYDITNPASPIFLTNYDYSSDAGGLSPGGILGTEDGSLYATMGQVIGIGTSVARVSLHNPSEPRIMEWLSLNSQVAGINRGPFFANDDVYGRILLMANSKYKAVAVDVP